MICDVVMEPSFDKHGDQNDIIFRNEIRCFVNSGHPVNDIIFEPPYLVEETMDYILVKGTSNKGKGL